MFEEDPNKIIERQRGGMDGPLHREHWRIVVDRGIGIADTTIYDGYEIDRVFIRIGQMALSLDIEQIVVYRNGEEYRRYELKRRLV